ncbi:MAG: hypothetical protein ABI585_06350 [Betaproteobacteria bacterium]
MIGRAGVIVLGVACVAVALAGGGERPQVVNYKQGKYQGKPDQPPFAGAPFDGNQSQWDNAIRQRNQAQNEYKRIGS